MENPKSSPLAETDDNIDADDRAAERAELAYEDHLTDLANQQL